MNSDIAARPSPKVPAWSALRGEATVAELAESGYRAFRMEEVSAAAGSPGKVKAELLETAVRTIVGGARAGSLVRSSK